MAQKDDNMVLADRLALCLTQASAEERHAQWKALTADFSSGEIIDALAARYASQQEALQRKQALAEERQTLLNTYLGKELPNAEAKAAQNQEDADFLKQQVKGYEKQFVQLQQLAREAQSLLGGVTAQRDEALAWNAELTKRYEQTHEALAQLQQEAHDTRIQLQQQVHEAQTQLNAVTAERDAASEMNTELLERIGQASLHAAQMATEVARLEKLFFVRLYNKLRGKK